MRSLVLYSVLLNFVASPTIIDECPELPKCNCNTILKRAKCTNMMEIPAVQGEIQILELYDNATINIKRSDFKHTSLTELFLNNNNIDSIDDDAFVDLSELKLLNLSNNRLRRLSKDMFTKNKKLKYLHVDNNPNLEFLLTKLPDSIEQLSVANTNAIMPHAAIQKLSNLSSYNGRFCLKRNCSHSTNLNIDIIRDDDLNNPTADTTQTTTKDGSHVVTNSSNLKSDTQTTTAESLSLPVESKVISMDWTNTDITNIVLGLFVIGLLLYVIRMLYKIQTIILETNMRRTSSDQQLLQQ